MKIALRVISLLFVFLFVIGFSRVFINYMSGTDLTFFPSGDEILDMFTSTPNFLEDFYNDLNVISITFTKSANLFDNITSSTFSSISTAWDNADSILDYFSALGYTIIEFNNLLTSYLTGFFVFLQGFGVIFIAIFHLVITPVKFLIWFFGTLLGFGTIFA